MMSVLAVVPMGGDAVLYRADGLAAAGLGLFGALIVLVPNRRIERWAWFALWFYPFFWLAHLRRSLKRHIARTLYRQLNTLYAIAEPAPSHIAGARLSPLAEVVLLRVLNSLTSRTSDNNGPGNEELGAR